VDVVLYGSQSGKNNEICTGLRADKREDACLAINTWRKNGYRQRAGIEGKPQIGFSDSFAIYQSF
jgi:hypothetical protein